MIDLHLDILQDFADLQSRFSSGFEWIHMVEAWAERTRRKNLEDSARNKRPARAKTTPEERRAQRMASYYKNHEKNKEKMRARYHEKRV